MVGPQPGAPRAGKLPAYLRSAVLNGARSQVRRRIVRRRHLATATAPGPSGDPSEASDRPDPARCSTPFVGCPTRQREVLVLRYYADLSEADIAATLGIAPGSVKTHAHRGLAALATHLEAPR